MDLAAALVSGLLALLCATSAVRKLSHSSAVVASYERAGVPEHRLNALAAVLLAAAGGLVAGVAWSPIGVAASAGLIVYFALAVVAHLRADDREHVATPTVMFVLAVASFVLQLLAT
jgi:DoxX-like family